MVTSALSVVAVGGVRAREGDLAGPPVETLAQDAVGCGGYFPMVAPESLKYVLSGSSTFSTFLINPRAPSLGAMGIRARVPE